MVWDGDGVVDNVGNRVNKKRKETVGIGCLDQVDRVRLSRESFSHLFTILVTVDLYAGVK